MTAVVQHLNGLVTAAVAPGWITVVILRLSSRSRIWPRVSPSAFSRWISATRSRISGPYPACWRAPGAGGSSPAFAQPVSSDGLLSPARAHTSRMDSTAGTGPGPGSASAGSPCQA